MLLFNKLLITSDGKYLIIDTLVEDSDYFTDVYIDKIYFDTLSTYNSTGPSTKAVTVWDSDDEDEDTKEVSVTYDIDTLGDNLFFVYVVAKGTPDSSAPCGTKDSIIMCPVYNKYLIYTQAMKYLNELEGCTPPNDLINFILRVKALDLCIETGNFTKAITYWNKFFTESAQVVTYNCGCNGN